MTRPDMSPTRYRKWLTSIGALTGSTAAVGGALLIARPDGHLIGARTSALAGSPFTSWRVPGILLLVLVGGGFLATAFTIAVGARFGPALSVIAGLGLMLFEICEMVWLGFQPLEFVFLTVGLIVVALGLLLARTQEPPVGARFPRL